MLDNAVEAGADLRVLVVANCIDQQLLQGLALKNFAQDIEDRIGAECFTLLLQLAKEPEKHVTFTGALCDKIPKVALFTLTDTVNTAKSLLQPVGIPRQIIVHHQVSTLKVDAFTGCIGRNEDGHLGVISEGLLYLAPLLAWRLAVDGDDRGWVTQ